MSNEEKHNVTDLPQIRKQEEDKSYLEFAEKIVEQIEKNKTKEEILHMILEANGGLKTDPREMKYFTDMVDIVFDWYFENVGKELDEAIAALLVKMEEAPKYLYKGNDGKDYATRTELEEANENYKKNPKGNI